MQHEFDLLVWDQPTFQVSGIGGVNSLHGGVRLAHFVDFCAHGCSEREQAFTEALASSPRDEEAHAFDGAALGASARPIHPQNSNRENIFDGGGVLAGSGGEQRPSVRTFVHDAADVGAGEGIFQVGRGGE
jgi:hypothetical protein